MEQRVTVITGGAGGIAKASARRLAERGPLLLADLTDDGLAAASAELRESGIEAQTALCDVSDESSIAELARRTAELGRLGALVHTAGLAPPAARDPRAVFEVNAVGTARLLEAFLPLAEAGTAGICIASLAGHREFVREFDELLAHPERPGVWERLEELGASRSDVLRTYSLSKRSIILQVRHGAAAWGARGARLVSISPGLVVDTTIGAGASTIHAGAYAEQSALARPGYAADIAGVVAFAASDDAGYVTGTDLLADGGVVAFTLDHADRTTRDTWNSANYS